MKEGIIFDRGLTPAAVPVARNVARLRHTVFVLDKFGKGLLVGAGILVLWVVWPVAREEARYGIGQTPAGQFVEKVSNVEPAQMVTIVTDDEPERPSWSVPDEKYSIYIPKIMAKSRIIEGVDAFDKKSYLDALQHGVAEAKGLAKPGEMGTTYLFAHSVGSRVDFARYNAIFYLLHRLEVGDRIEIMFEGKLYKYQMAERHIVSASDLSFITPQNKEEKLVLQTCYPPGTSWKRLMVVAKPVKM